VTKDRLFWDDQIVLQESVRVSKNFLSAYHGEFLSRNFESSYFKISLDWVLLGTFPTFQICIFKKKSLWLFLRNWPIVLIFHDFRKKLTIFSRLFTHFMQSFDSQGLKMCQKIILVILRPPLWAKIWIFWLKFFFFFFFSFVGKVVRWKIRFYPFLVHILPLVDTTWQNVWPIAHKNTFLSLLMHFLIFFMNFRLCIF
jgi:hypothetical protein